MKKKVFMNCVRIVLMALLLTACGAPEQQPDTEEFEKDIDICLNGYDQAGGLIVVTSTDEDGNQTEEEYGSVCMLGAVGETIGDVIACDYEAFTPVLEGDVFEGWMEYAYDDDEGNYVVFPETLCSMDELLALPVPDHAVSYVAKWQSIPAEEYFVVNPWEDSSTNGGFAFTANGGTMSFHEADGIEYAAPAYTYWLDEDQSLSIIMGTEYAALIGIEKEGSEFAGWTLYKAEDMFWSDTEVQEDDLLCLLYNEEDTWGGRYILLRNAELVGENMSTEQLCGMTCGTDNYLAVASWN